MKQIIHEEILQQEVTRKQFLQVMVLGIVSILGFNNLLSMLTKLNKSPTNSRDRSSHSGFGSSKFGV